MCDASAAFALDEEHFVVASNDDNILRVYKRGHPAVKEMHDLGKFVKIKNDGNKKKKNDKDDAREVDIEGVARLGNLYFWIGSHGQNRDGHDRPERHQLFAMKIEKQGEDIVFEEQHTPYRTLIKDVLAGEKAKDYKLEETSKLGTGDQGGLNIEGLVAAPDGGLWIGFRSPLKDKTAALILPLQNPTEVIKGKAAAFGEPISLSLGKGYGIRSLEIDNGRYLIVAGPSTDAGDQPFKLFQWSGRADEAPAPITANLGGIAPEAVFTIPGKPGALYLLSDDGDQEVKKGVACKKLEDTPEKQSFRGRLVTY
ncbi:hypothetical protein TSO221_14815 [Azospirillum sp. TSO22-1]|nr:hypothetical protein TSO221_14815 [Azospirillum sp. TSO22-1]